MHGPTTTSLTSISWYIFLTDYAIKILEMFFFFFFFIRAEHRQRIILRGLHIFKKNFNCMGAIPTMLQLFMRVVILNDNKLN